MTSAEITPGRLRDPETRERPGSENIGSAPPAGQAPAGGRPSRVQPGRLRLLATRHRPPRRNLTRVCPATEVHKATSRGYNSSCGHQTAGDPLDMQGTHAAATKRLTETGVDGTGNASGSSAAGLPALTPGSLDNQPKREQGRLPDPPNPHATLPLRKRDQPPQIPILRPTEAETGGVMTGKEHYRMAEELIASVTERTADGRLVVRSDHPEVIAAAQVHAALAVAAAHGLVTEQPAVPHVPTAPAPGRTAAGRAAHTPVNTLVDPGTRGLFEQGSQLGREPRHDSEWHDRRGEAHTNPASHPSDLLRPRSETPYPPAFQPIETPCRPDEPK